MLSNPTLDGGLVAPSITIWLVLAVAVMGGPRRIRLNAKAKAAVTATEARRPRRSMANTYLYRKDRNMCYHIRRTIRQTPASSSRTASAPLRWIREYIWQIRYETRLPSHGQSASARWIRQSIAPDVSAVPWPSRSDSAQGPAQASAGRNWTRQAP